MNTNYFYCSHCGYEDFDIFVAFAESHANGDFYYCPKCNNLSSEVEGKL
jgi:hypothetical protein